jgi:hypothetical protein
MCVGGGGYLDRGRIVWCRCRADACRAGGYGEGVVGKRIIIAGRIIIVGGVVELDVVGRIIIIVGSVGARAGVARGQVGAHGARSPQSISPGDWDCDYASIRARLRRPKRRGRGAGSRGRRGRVWWSSCRVVDT